MKHKQKNILYMFTLIIISFIMLTNNIKANAITANNKNIDLVILFNDNTIDKRVKDIIANSSGEIINEFPDLGGIEVRCPANLIPTIKSVHSVQSLAPNHIIKLQSEKVEAFTESEDISNSTYLTIDSSTSSAVSAKISSDLYEKHQWDIKRVTNNGKSLYLESGNHNVVVGIIDSGVDATHPDLVNNFLGGKNLIPANFKDDSSETGDSDDISDRIGHGTNVAGIIAANGRTKGIAPNIGFKSYRVFNKNGETNATICSSAIIDATNDGVKVINLSISNYELKGKCYWTDSDTGIRYYLGDDMAEYSLCKRAIKYAIKNGVTVVTAAGNEGQDCSNKKKLTSYLNREYGDSGFKYEGLTYESPGTVKDVITVSATDKNDKLASYSNYGKDFIDVSAPGGDISDMCFTTDIDSGYTFVAGTSFAAPKVSAVAAIIICNNRYITPKSVAKRIYKTADELDNDHSSKYYGAGIVNAYNVLQ